MKDNVTVSILHKALEGDSFSIVYCVVMGVLWGLLLVTLLQSCGPDIGE